VHKKFYNLCNIDNESEHNSCGNIMTAKIFPNKDFAISESASRLVQELNIIPYRLLLKLVSGGRSDLPDHGISQENRFTQRKEIGGKAIELKLCVTLRELGFKDRVKHEAIEHYFAEQAQHTTNSSVTGELHKNDENDKLGYVEITVRLRSALDKENAQSATKLLQHLDDLANLSSST
jgi:hypothetical protein